MALHWVRLKRHCELSGDTPEAVRGRLKAGHWLRDIHVRRPVGSEELWVNLDAVNDWAAGRLPVTDHGKQSDTQ